MSFVCAAGYDRNRKKRELVEIKECHFGEWAQTSELDDSRTLPCIEIGSILLRFLTLMYRYGIIKERTALEGNIVLICET